MIDLHLHTTSSDGRSTPYELVEEAAAAGLTVMAVTDHDTAASIAEVAALAGARGIEAVPGIEFTAVEDGRDVHVLGYFLDASRPALAAFLAEQRQARLARVEAIGQRLESLGMPIATAGILAEARLQPGRAIGRPRIARALVAAGHATDIQDAFTRWLGAGAPAFVARTGASIATVIDAIHGAGGLASLAHPGRTAIDPRIASLREAGLDALEAFHSDHDAGTVRRYAQLAADLGLLVSGGSDYHADPARPIRPGSTSLPPDDWTRLRAARHRHA